MTISNAKKGLWILFGLVFCLLIAVPSGAQLSPGTKAPSIKARDIRGKEVDLEKLLEKDLVILFFFSRTSGQDIAAKLKEIHQTREEKLPIIAVGLKEDEDALRQFANELGISYYVLKNTPEVNADSKYGPFDILPMTFFVISDGTIYRVVPGGGQGPSSTIAKTIVEIILLKAKATNEKEKRKSISEDAAALAQELCKIGLDEKTSLSLAGYAYAEMENYEAAETCFQKAGDLDGLAFVALSRGDNAKAIEIADQVGEQSGYAQTVKAIAMLRAGKQDEAAELLHKASQKPLPEWQAAEVQVHLGRLKEMQGDMDSALSAYETAMRLNPLNVVAITNASEVLRQRGEFEKAEALLQTAKERRLDDSYVLLLLDQIRQDMEFARDAARRETIKKQIDELVARFKENKEGTKNLSDDNWTSHRVVMALLPGRSFPGAYLERSGIDTMLRYALELNLSQNPRIQIVEREKLEKVLDELNIGSSELADPSTQLRLGKIFAANVLGFVDFLPSGKDLTAFMRLVDTETTILKGQVSRKLDTRTDLSLLANDVAKEVQELLAKNYLLQGYVQEIKGDDIIINLGSEHGVEVGQSFSVLKEGIPGTSVSGTSVSKLPMPIGIIKVVSTDTNYSCCRVDTGTMRGTEPIAKGMKVKQLPPR